MKQLFFYLMLLVLGLGLTNCSKDEPEPEPEPEFIDLLVGNYNGTLTSLTCTFPQTVFLEDTGSSASITRQSDSEVNISLVSSAFGEVFNFNAMIDSDSSFVIPEFVMDTDTFRGSGRMVENLRIFLGDGCVVLGNETATTTFEEQ